MSAVEEVAREEGKTVLVLDTVPTGGDAERLYELIRTLHPSACTARWQNNRRHSNFSSGGNHEYGYPHRRGSCQECHATAWRGRTGPGRHQKVNLTRQAQQLIRQPCPLPGCHGSMQFVALLGTQITFART